MNEQLLQYTNANVLETVNIKLGFALHLANLRTVYCDVKFNQNIRVMCSFFYFLKIFSESPRAHVCVSGVHCADGRRLGVEQKPLCFLTCLTGDSKAIELSREGYTERFQRPNTELFDICGCTMDNK